MTNWQSGWRKLTRVWRGSVTSDVDSELQFQFDHKVAEFVGHGPTRDAATACAEFGDVDAVRATLQLIDERMRQGNRWQFSHALGQLVRTY